MSAGVWLFSEKQSKESFEQHPVVISKTTTGLQGAQWLSSRVLDSRLRGREFVPHRRHYVVVLEQDAFILA